MSLCRGAYAEEQAIINALELDSLQQYAQSHSFDFSEWLTLLISGGKTLPDDLFSLIEKSAHQTAVELKNIVSAVLVPLSVLLILKIAIPGRSSFSHTTSFVCRISCIPALYTVFLHMQQQAQTLIQNILTCCELMSPAMISSVILSGAETTATILSPMTGVCAELIEGLLVKWGIEICSAAACLAIAGSFSRSIRLKRLHGLLRRFVHWGTSVLLAGFMAILSLQGKLGAAKDSAAVRTTRYAIENIIPVIGGRVSDSLDALLASANIVKNALGISGIALIFAICIAPVIRIFLCTLTLRITSAVCEPMGDNDFADLASQFADCIEMLLIISVAAAVLLGLLTGSFIGAASEIMR